MKDRRKVERFSLELPAEITVKTTEQMVKVLRVTTRNISCGGAFCSGVHPLPEGTPVRVNLTLSAERLKRLVGAQAHVEIGGIVKRSEPSGMAICFNGDYHMISINTERKHGKGTIIKWGLYPERRAV
jgi:hypothetical protein